MMEQQPSPLEQLKRALAAGVIDQDTFDAAVAGITAQVAGSGAVAQGRGAAAVGASGVGIAGDSHGDINTSREIAASENARIVYAEQGATVVIGDAPVEMREVDRESVLGRYLRHLIAQNRYLQLQGIRSGGRLVNIELDRIYVTLRATRQSAERTRVDWLAEEQTLAPGEEHRSRDQALSRDTTQITVNQALAEQRRLLVLGDPGSGKTTLLHYVALLYARDLAGGTRLVTDKLGLEETGTLPILLPLRQIGRYLAKHRPKDDGTEGHAVLLEFFLQVLKDERIEVRSGFFDKWLKGGRAAVLLDGLDEVADPDLRRRVSRLVDAFTRAYDRCRFVVTSRIVGYTDSSRLNEGYAATTVRDFSMDNVRRFLSQWHRLVAIGQMGPGETAETQAANQTRQLLEAIDKNDWVRELAINPLMLTVIALVHRDRVKLPDRRAELYQEAVEVLLGKWDEARGVPEAPILSDGRPFDIGNRQLLLQQLALTMHEQNLKEIDAGPLKGLLSDQLARAVPDPWEREATVGRFLAVIRERTGLLIARAEGTYAFSHLTFQEYLAARAIAGCKDYLDYSLRRCGDAWWRETILLEAGFLSTQGQGETKQLICAIADAKTEPEPYHNLVLAAECLRDAGANRILGGLELERDLRGRLQRELETPPARGAWGAMWILFTRGMSPVKATRRRIAAAEALGRIGGTRFWTPPHGEPEWVAIPPGEFTMGKLLKAHRVKLGGYSIARVLVTNAQYRLFVQATGHEPPGDWDGKRIPKGRESHPVAYVSWRDALAYCIWLSEATGKPITLPNEAEWERAARGDKDKRAYPWGNHFDRTRCNVYESGFGGTTPVGIFQGGESPFGCLDMAGNLWEWTRSRYASYPYQADDGREDPDPKDNDLLVVRGGAWNNNRDNARCAYRNRNQPDNRNNNLGFRDFFIHEPKRRKISAAPFRDRVVHHALCNLIEPLFDARFIEHSYANRKGKGTHRALDRLQDYARRFRYVLRCDVVRHFPSLDHAILRDKLARVIQDEDALWLADLILASGVGVLDDEYRMTYFPGDDLLAGCRPRGLPIGNLTSQFWSNVYLNDFDWFVQRGLGCGAYLRYVDDFALFSDSKSELYAWKNAVLDRLAHERLRIHESAAQVLPTSCGIPWLGFVVYPTHRLLKRRNAVKFTRRLEQNIDAYSSGRISFAELDASVKGWVNHVRFADTWGLREHLFETHPLRRPRT